VTAVIDPGEPTATPAGTGPLGHPVGTGQTWADPGDIPSSVPNAPADGTAGNYTRDQPMAPPQDGTGSR
jgi:hypothetical protein